MFYFELIARLGQAFLAEYDEREARFLAREVVKRASGFSATKLALLNREVVPKDVFAQADLLEKRLVSGEPWQYITGEAEFFGHIFSVGPGVLIPRPETEMLVQEAIKYGDTLQGPVRVLDACTGSGCIAHSIALARPHWQVEGFDISPEALHFAHINGEKLGSTARIFQADLLGPVEAICLPHSIDILVSNPPYVPISEKESLAKHVREHEPELALFAPENDPLVYYEALEKFGKYCLTTDGIVILELFSDLSNGVLTKFSQKWRVEAIKDQFGRPRIALAQKT